MENVLSSQNLCEVMYKCSDCSDLDLIVYCYFGAEGYKNVEFHPQVSLY